MAGDTGTDRQSDTQTDTERCSVAGDTETDTQSDTQTDTERCSWLGTQRQTDRVTHRLAQRGVDGWGYRDRQTE